MTFAEAAMIMMSGGGANIQPLTVTANGLYEAPKGVDGYNPVNVNVPDRYDEGYEDGRNSFVTSHLLAKENHKTYIASELGVDGFHRVSVDIDDTGNIKPLDVTENKIYYAADYGCDGFNPVNVNVPDKYDDGYDKGYEDGWEASAGYYDGSGASTDKHYLLHIFVDTVSIPGYQNTNPVAFHLYEKKDGAWSIVNKSMHYANGNAHYSYDTKINYIKLSPEYGKPSYVGLTGWTKDHSISRTEVFNYSNALVYGVSSKNCALTSVAPTA